MQLHIEALRADLGRVLADARDIRNQLLSVHASHDLALPVLQRHGFEATAYIISDRLGGTNEWDEGPVWVAVRDRRVVGTVAAVPRGPELYVRSMAVVPSARGQRAGESLLKRVEEFASAHGYERLTLTTTPFLSRAIRLYERAGFRPSGRGPLKLFGTPLFEMVKDLGPRRS